MFCHWLSEIKNKNKKQKKMRKKMNFYASCFYISQICFNESDDVTLHSIMNIMTENDAKWL